MHAPSVLFIAITPRGVAEAQPAWQESVREALAEPVAAGRLSLHFALVRSFEDLRDRLRSGRHALVHVCGQPGTLPLGGDGGSELSASGAFAKLSAEQLEEPSEADTVALECVVVTGSLSRSRTEPTPIAGVPLTIVMPGTLDGGGALEFTRAFYTALAAGLDITAAFGEGREGALHHAEDEVFEAVLFKAGERVIATRRPFDELRALKDSARAISARILEVQRQLSLSSSLTVGDLLADRFVLEELISFGGFTEIWKAYDRETHVLVAVKVLHDAWARDAYRVARFERAALGMEELRHPGIVELISRVERDHGRRFFVMRWYSGGDLRRAVERGLDPDVALRACADAIEGLAHAHHHRVLHRDFRPGHVLLDEDSRGCLTDFDLDGSESEPAMLRGAVAPPYAAPELWPRLDARTDLYGAAMCVLFVLRGGEPPTGDPLVCLDELEYCTEELHEALASALVPDKELRRTTSAGLVEAIRSFVATPPSSRRRLVAGWAEQGEDEYGRWAVLDVNGVRQRMRWIERGRFSMGSDNAADMSHLAKGWRRPGPVHSVTLSQGFWLADTECTQAMWEAVMGDNPSEFKSPDRPVERVSWYDVQRFLTKLSELVGGPAFKLPTEAQWEYACRADTKTNTYGGPSRPLAEIAWYAANSQQTSRVRQKGCNQWGLHDILGNVWEWCEDPPRVYQGGPVVDPLGMSVAGREERVVRGGGWYSSELFGVRAADRMAEHPASRDARVGFRFARLG
jgi:formylglycine-generating enzyme required for sulfatase activity